MEIVDPNIVDKDLIDLFMQENDNSKYYESIILKTKIEK